jgi:hypothetical protein
MRHLAMIILASSVALAVAGIGVTSVAFAAPAYEIVIVPPTTTVVGPTFFRINVASGQVVYQSGTQFVVTPDSAALPAGNYHLYRTESLDRKGAWYMDRMDSESGRTWSLSGGGSSPFVWTEITEPK